MIQTILNLVYPEKCPFCRRILSRSERKGGGICGECRRRLPVIAEPFCKCCGKPVHFSETEYCHDCRARRHHFDEGRSVFLHKSPVSEAVYRLKYKNCQIYAGAFANEMYRLYGTWIYRREVDLIVPIPIHKKRLHERGYNQALLLAKKLSALTGIPCADDLLIRVKHTDRQKDHDDKTRRRNIAGAFAASGYLEGENVLLVDDIYTTGSTLDEAAHILRKAGAQKIYFLTISIGQGY